MRESSTIAHGSFDHEFDLDSHDWRCTKLVLVARAQFDSRGGCDPYVRALQSGVVVGASSRHVSHYYTEDVIRCAPL